MARVMDVSNADLESRREKMLQRLGVSYEDLIERAEQGALTGAEYEALEDLHDIAYLLGDA